MPFPRTAVRIWRSVNVRPDVHDVQKVWRMETLIVFLLADVLLEPRLLHALTNQDSQKFPSLFKPSLSSSEVLCSCWQHFV